MGTKDIEGYQNYFVTTDGDVYSKNYLRKHICQKLKQASDKRGYKRVSLASNGGQRSFLVHQLVAKAFIPNPFKFTGINHIDSVTNHNFVENLEWSDQVHNLLHAHQTNNANINMSKGENHRSHKLTEADVLVIRCEYREKHTLQEVLAETYGITSQSVSDIIRRVTWKHI